MRLDASVPSCPSCPNCGRPARDQDKFCEGCGASLACPDQEMPRYCQKCGTQLWGNVTFCTRCGSSVATSVDDSEITIYGMPPIRRDDNDDDFRNMRIVYGMPPWMRGH